MKQFRDVTLEQFVHNPQLVGSFSVEGASELYDYLTDFSSEQEGEFDPIAIRSHYSEVSSLEQLEREFPDHEQRLVLEFKGGFIVG